MTGSLNISTIEKNDFEALVNLVNSAYRGESSKKGWTTEADLLDGQRTDLQSIHSILLEPGAVLLTAKDENQRLVGCVYLQQQEHTLYLGMLTVAPDIQAKGIGNQLLLAAEKYARKNDCKTIRMTVIDVRHELIDWYKRKGYQSTGEIKPFPSDPKFGLPKQPLQFMVLEKILQDFD
jgi:ribosomal protein S18 acetylase RimI-like enzyme